MSQDQNKAKPEERVLWTVTAKGPVTIAGAQKVKGDTALLTETVAADYSHCLKRAPKPKADSKAKA